MLSRWPVFTLISSALKGTVTAFLCLSLACPLGIAAQQPTTPPLPGASQVHGKLSEQQRILHALNRFTFGARPEDEAVVARMGLDAWFEQQLRPNSISDSALDERLARFPAMQLQQAALVARFPPPQVLRLYSGGAVQPPSDPVEQAIYADAAFGYKQQVEAAKAAQQNASVPAGGSAQAAASMDSPGMDAAGTSAAPPQREQQLTPKKKRKQVGEPLDDAAAQAILALPPEQRIQRLISMSPEDVAALRAALRGPEQQRLYQGLSPVQMEQVAAMQSPVRVVGAEAISARLLRDVYSERQLQAVMTDFWLNHFSVYIRKNQNEPYLLPAYERETILPHALGRFEDLLVATAQSPAMLMYLDNWTSIGPHSRAAERVDRFAAEQPGTPLGKFAAKMPKGINENYARELMELHTLGVKGGYTQQDVIEVAKCFTGWTIDRPAKGGGFTFNPNRHEPGSKTVLGHVIREGGENEGLEVLHILATSPATAHFVSLKLAERFVSDNPPPAMVDRMTTAYLKSNGDISTVLRTMFRSPEFWSPAVYRGKVKTPIEFMASALRASNAEVTNPLPLVQAMARLGMPIFGMQTPNGYSWQADAWVSSNALLTRMNFALSLSGNRLPGTRLDWEHRLGAETEPASAADPAEENRLETLLLGQPAAAQTRAAVLAGAQDPTAIQTAEQNFRARPVDDENAMYSGAGMMRTNARRGANQPWAEQRPDTPLATMAGLLLGSPDFQRR